MGEGDNVKVNCRGPPKAQNAVDVMNENVIYGYYEEGVTSLFCILFETFLFRL
jgi:hypothetical protein